MALGEDLDPGAELAQREAALAALGALPGDSRYVEGWLLAARTCIGQLDFEGADAHIECVMEDEAGASLSRCRIVVTYVDRATGRPADWPAGAIEPFVVREAP